MVVVVPPTALLQIRRGPAPAGAGTAGWPSRRQGVTALVVVVAAAALSRRVVVVMRKREVWVRHSTSVGFEAEALLREGYVGWWERLK